MRSLTSHEKEPHVITMKLSPGERRAYQRLIQVQEMKERTGWLIIGGFYNRADVDKMLEWRIRDFYHSLDPQKWTEADGVLGHLLARTRTMAFTGLTKRPTIIPRKEEIFKVYRELPGVARKRPFFGFFTEESPLTPIRRAGIFPQREVPTPVERDASLGLLGRTSVAPAIGRPRFGSFA